MGWWPFKKKSESRPIPDVIRRDTRSWLSDLQEVCERNFGRPKKHAGRFDRWLENGVMLTVKA